MLKHPCQAGTCAQGLTDTRVKVNTPFEGRSTTAYLRYTKISPKTGQDHCLVFSIADALFTIVAQDSVDSVVAYGAGFV